MEVRVAPTVTVDGKPVPVTLVETPLLNITLPKDNIFGLPEGTQGLSVGAGWVALLDPLMRGTYKIVIDEGKPRPPSRPRSSFTASSVRAALAIPK